MKILYLCTWPLTGDGYVSTEYPKTEFGYYTMVKKGYSIDSYAPNWNNPLISKIQKIKPSVFKPIFTQVGFLANAKNYDVIYVAFDMHLLPLAIVKMLGLCKTPIFVLSHFTYNSSYTKSRWKKLYKKIERKLVFRYINRMSFASEQLLKIAIGGGKIFDKQNFVANWGASLDFYNRSLYRDQPTGGFFMAAGGMNRDYHTLIKAFRKTPNAQLKVFAKYRDYTNGEDIPENVRFENLMHGHTYVEAHKLLRDYYYNCIAICLPIDYINDVPNGATVLVEALAMGKPIIITEADTNYIDVEKEGCGLTVKSHDADSWIKAIEYMLANPSEVERMGQRSYELAITKYNDTNFVNTIYNQMKELVKEKNHIDTDK